MVEFDPCSDYSLCFIAVSISIPFPPQLTPHDLFLSISLSIFPTPVRTETVDLHVLSEDEMFLKLQLGAYSDAEAVSVALKQSVQGMCVII